MIESVTMGKLLFQGKVSRSDTIVYKDHMNTKWWIKSRNCIEMEDLEDVLSVSPKAVIFGLGFMLPITVSDSTVRELEKMGIEVFAGKTEEAAEVFNSKVKKMTTVGLFHLL